MTTLHGQGVSRGVALGVLRFFHQAEAAVEKQAVQDSSAELARFEAARCEAIAQLDTIYRETVSTLGEENALLFQIHQMILEDPDLCDAICSAIQRDGASADYAVDAACRAFAATFSAMDDTYMQARSADVIDVAQRLLQILSGANSDGLMLAEPAIIAASDLVPSETARLDREKALAFVTAGGSHNSHTAIFARTMGIPAIVGLGGALSASIDGHYAAVDGKTGELVIDPTPEALALFQARKQAEEARQLRAGQFRGKPTATRSGRRISLCANVGSLADIEEAKRNDAEGIGLFRSEFLYLKSDNYPSEEVQFHAYRAAVEQMGGKRVVIRTLDIGADKQAGYFQLPPEDNPAMGMRAIRICLTRPALFVTQLRALYRASAYGKLAIMFPMVTHPSEVRRIQEIASQVRESLHTEGVAFNANTELGIMVETPAAALLSGELAGSVDFFSVGTNDLTQYTLALDRQNSSVASFDDPEHAAVLRLIAMTAENAHKAGIWVGICGELGADESLASTFLQMGIDELSVTPTSLLSLRARIAELP